MHPKSNKKSLALVLLLALCIRLAYCWYFYEKKGYSNFVDDNDYISYANQILEQGIWVPDISKIESNGHQAGIGWPLILSGILFFAGEKYFIVFIFNALLGTLLCWLVYLLSYELFTNRNTALIAALWTALYIHFIKFSPSVLKENLIHFFLAATLLLLIRVVKYRQTKHLIYFALVYVFFIHIDERYFIFFPLSILFLLLYGKVSFKKGITDTFVFSALVGLLMIPWLIRNNQVYKRPVILAYQTSEFTDPLFVTDTTHIVTGQKSRITSYNRKNLPLYEQLTRDIIYKRFNDSLYGDVAFVKEMKQGIKDGLIPVTYSMGKSKWEEFKEFFRPCRFHTNYLANGYRLFTPRPLLSNILGIIQYGTLIPLFIIAVIMHIKSKYALTLLPYAFFVMYTLFHLIVVYALERYRIPIDFIIIIIGTSVLDKISYLHKFLSAGTNP